MIAGQQLWVLNVAVVQFLAACGQFVLVVVASFAILCLLVSFFRFQMMTHRVRHDGVDDLHPRDAFQLQVIERLGTAHRTPPPFCVMLVEISDLSAFVAQNGEEIGHEIAGFALNCVQESVRKTDTVRLCDNDTIGMIVNAPRRFVAGITQRIIGNLAKEPCQCSNGVSRRVAVRIGVATFPEDGAGVDDLMASATAALRVVGAREAPAWELAGQAGGEAAEPADAAEPVPDQSALVDPLTGVLKSARLPTAMQKFIARFRKEEQPVSVLYLDVDYLKRYNEHYGQAAGDAVLQGVGKLLQEVVREEDLIARYAGEEFIVLMGAPPREALIAGQRVALAVKRAAFAFAQTQLRITVSIGVAGYPDHGGTPKQLFSAAETALHAAKAKGRGRCMMYDPSMVKPKRTDKTVDTF